MSVRTDRTGAPERIVRLLAVMPGRTSAQIARILNIGRPHSATSLLELTRRGVLRRVREEGEGGTTWHYYVVKEER